jgi:glycosyltransferase involved in cell wall biosynthesis
VKVLFLNPIASLGGAEQGLLDLISSLRKSAPDLEIEVLLLEAGPLLAELTAMGAQVDVLRLPEALASLGENRQSGATWFESARATAALAAWLPRFSAAVRRKRAQILHSNGLKTHLLAALVRPTGVPLIWHLHDLISTRTVTSRVLPLLQRRATIGVAISEAVAQDARPVLRRLRLETVLNGVRTEHFAPGRVSPADLDTLAQLPRAPNKTVRVGLVGTYALWKGHHLFLDAVSKVTVPNVRFYIVGGPVYSTLGSQLSEGELRERIAQLGLEARCGLIGFQRSIAAIYAGLDIVVHASTRPEPFGRTIAEAMASGRAVIAAGVGGALEQINDRENGLLFPPGDPGALGEKVALLATDNELRHKLQGAALVRARSHLDAARLGPTVAGLYETLRREGAAPRPRSR